MRGDRGSILPIAIAGLALAVMATLIFLELTGVQVQTLRNKQLADVMVLKVSTDLKNDGIAPVAGLDYFPPVKNLAVAAAKNLRITPTRVLVRSNDGKTMEAMVCTEWQSITGLRLSNFGQVCASSKARAIS